MGVLDAFATLGKNINKMRGKTPDENIEGAVSERLPELSLEMENEEIIKLTGKWKKSWDESEVKARWLEQSQENDKYWKGNQHAKLEADKSRAMVDNVIFEALETYLPQITRRNPEPMVELAKGVPEDDKEAAAYAKDLKEKLAETADELNFRLKLKKAGRFWAIYLLGAARLGWDLDRNLPTFKIVRPQRLILDPDSTVDEDGYNGKFVGEFRKKNAQTLIDILEQTGGEKEGIEEVKKLVEKDTGTEVQYIDWSTPTYMCWTLDKKVLLKKKNPNWNYDTERPAPADEMSGDTPVDAEGKPVMESVPGFNHFPSPRIPYEFLSVFNLGEHPVDDTSLITQNLSNQDLLNKRNKQIDKNADSMNNGMVVSLGRSGLTKEQAKGVTDALRKGGTVVIPDGSPREAIERMSPPGLPNDVYQQVIDTRQRMRDIFGTSGSTPAGLRDDKTVRGKLMTRSADTDRIGGGVSEYLEQFADSIYNWFVQLLYVYDDQYAIMANKPRITVSVKEGSLLPKDSASIAAQAIELAGAGKMSLLDLYKRLDEPNPEEMAANAWLEVNAPQLLYTNDPRVAQAMQMQQAAAAEPPKAPSESISFKDLTPDAKAQMLAKVNIQADPEAIAAYNDTQDTKKAETAAMAKPKLEPVST